MHRNRRQPGLGIMLLLYQLFGVIGIDRIPPVTLGAIGLQTAIFLRLITLPWRNASEICVSAYKVWHRKEYMRLIYSAFEHGDDWHLYYNMVSFALKGQSLERRFGSMKFLYIISVFTLLTNVVVVALAEVASGYDRNLIDQCAIGFSGVIFALKVLTTYYDPNYTHRIHGVPSIIPARYAVWFELILIQIVVPNASFIGHLAGILVGMCYVKGPLKALMDFIYNLFTGAFSPAPLRPRFQPHAEATGHRNEHFMNYVPQGMSEEEQIRQAMAASLTEETMSYHHYQETPYPSTSSGGYTMPPPPAGFVPPHYDNVRSPPPPGFAPDIEELRNRRQARFTNH